VMCVCICVTVCVLGGGGGGGRGQLHKVGAGRNDFMQCVVVEITRHLGGTACSAGALLTV
jgi:hypothetical protein